MGNLDEHDLVNEIGRAVRRYTQEDFGAASVYVATKNLFARVEAKGDGSVNIDYDVPLPLTIKRVAACGHAQTEPTAQEAADAGAAGIYDDRTPGEGGSA